MTRRSHWWYGSGDGAAAAAAILAKAERARQMAFRAQLRAERAELARNRSTGALSEFHDRVAGLHRIAQHRQESTARLQEAFGNRLVRFNDRRPALAGAISQIVGEPNVAVHLVTTSG